ncbi:MAG: GtrA family protein [bacterium]
MKEKAIKIKNTIFTYEFLRFFIISATAVLIDFLILNYQVYVLKFNPFFFGLFSTANIISASISIIFNFGLQRIWSFNHKEGNILHQAWKFLFVHSINLVFFNGILYGMFSNLGLIPPVAKIVSTTFQMFWSFVMYKYFVFKKIDNK